MLTRNLDADQRFQFMAELDAPADPWDAAELVWQQMRLPKAGD